MAILGFLFYAGGLIYMMVKGRDQKDGVKKFPAIVSFLLGLTVICNFIVVVCLFKLKNISDMDFRDKTSVIILIDAMALLVLMRTNKVDSVAMNTSIITISLMTSLNIAKNL